MTMMIRTAYFLFSYLFLSSSTCHAFTVPQQQHHHHLSPPHHSSSSSPFLLLSRMEMMDNPNEIITTTVTASSNIILSAATMQKIQTSLKAILITLLFGGGLIPATISANKAMIGTLTGSSRKNLDPIDDDALTLDPTRNRAPYIESSGGSGPELPGSIFLLANERIPLVDVIAIVGRMGSDVESIADWKNLPSAKLENVSVQNPPMWLPRATFKANIRKSKFRGWPIDPKTNQPVGGIDLATSEQSRISQSNALIGDAALDAVFDTWAWGASVATPDKVSTQLRDWRYDDGIMDISKVSSAAIRGRAVTIVAAMTFVLIQVLVYSSLFLAPFLRSFFDLDIGFGSLGSCDGPCTTLF